MGRLVDIRKADRSDVEILVDIGYRAWERGILSLQRERPGMRETERRRLGHIVVETIERIVVADVDGLPGGWCSRARGRAYIPFLFVAPELQGNGIGTLLLARMETMLELEGAPSVHLETPADNLRAVRFYERQGYRIRAMRPSMNRLDPLVSVRLEKPLRPFQGTISGAG